MRGAPHLVPLKMPYFLFGLSAHFPAKESSDSIEASAEIICLEIKYSDGWKVGRGKKSNYGALSSRQPRLLKHLRAGAL